MLLCNDLTFHRDAFNVEVLKAFVELFDFKDLPFDKALR